MAARAYRQRARRYLDVRRAPARTRRRRVGPTQHAHLRRRFQRPRRSGTSRHASSVRWPRGRRPHGHAGAARSGERRHPTAIAACIGEDTGFDIALVEQDAERTFVTSPGTESRLTPADLAAIPLAPGDAVYVSGYDLTYPVSGASLGAWLLALAPEQLLVIDPGPLAAEIPYDRMLQVLARTDILSLNAREAHLFTGLDDLATAASSLARRVAPDGWVVARDGPSGCWLASRDTSTSPQHIPPRPTRAVDTTGAGDTHVAALLARLAAGDELAEAARVANVAASLSVERPGPATGPTTGELEDVLSR